MVRMLERLSAPGEIIYTANGRWMADLAVVAARLLKLATPQPRQAPQRTGWSATALLEVEFPNRSGPCPS